MFKSALRSLLVKSDITPSPSANCLELDDTNQGTLGSVVLSSRKQKKQEPYTADTDTTEDFDGMTETLTIELNKPI